MKTETETPFVWTPGDGYSNTSLSRMRDQFRCPKQPMGEAWFMGEKRRMFDELMDRLDRLPVEALTKPLEEITSGQRCFGPLAEWTNWYHYLLAQLVPRSHEVHIEPLLGHLICGFFAQYPNGIEEPYAGFRSDALDTLGRCIMDAESWQDGQVRRGHLLHRYDTFPSGYGPWSDASEEFSASAFFCAKYLQTREIEPWLISMLSIDSAHWNAQVLVWLLGAHDMLVGKIRQPSELGFERRPSVTWAWSHSLDGGRANEDPANPSPKADFLPAANCTEILRVLKSALSQELFFKWLDQFKAHDYLEEQLAELPSRFAELYLPD
jgi:hypothetical protein